MKSQPRPVKRRRFLKYGLAGATLAAVAGTGLTYALFEGVVVNTIGKVDFDSRLRIPPLAGAQTDADGRKVFDLQLKHGKRQFKPGPETKTWGINGDYLGPTLRAARGDTVAVNVRNSLGETSSLHWHGMHLPAEMDGGPHQPVRAHDTWSPTWTIDQPAATLWYHPHPHGSTARHVYRGLAGMFILDDEAEAALELPRDYGVDDIPVIVQDKNFDDGGQLDDETSLLGDTGILGRDILVNGTYGPYLDVSSRKVRLRLLNASNARVFRFAFSDKRSFAMIASDGGLLAKPHSMRHIQLSPGERAEIVVDFEPGENVVLRSDPPKLKTGFFESRPHGGDDSFDILQFRAAEKLDSTPDLPGSLTEVPPIDIGKAVKTRKFDISGRAINGEEMEMGRIDFGAVKDSVEIWEVTNVDYSVHNFHVHDVQFQILSIGGEKPAPHLAGWKDTAYLDPGRKFRLALRFKDFADPDMPYMYHCHILYHEDSGLMGQFVVLDEGDKIGAVAAGDHAGHHGG